MKIKYIETHDGQRWLASEALAHIAAMKPVDAKEEVLNLFWLSTPKPTKESEA